MRTLDGTGNRARAYQGTHPWLTFTVDLSRASHKLWMLLGEAASKCEHLAGAPLRPETSRELHKIYLIKGVQATTAIEGNTLSEEDIRRRIDGTLHVPPSKQYLVQEVDNILVACQRIFSATLTSGTHALSVEQIRDYNSLVLAGLQQPEDVAPGQLRLHSVGVGRYLGAPAEDCQYLLDRLCAWLNDPAFCQPEEDGLVWGIVRAVLAHLYLAWIHPFGDGNGRTARLLEFQILVAAGVPSAAAHLLSIHYSQTRTQYYRQLEQASQDQRDGVLSFLHYAVQGFVDGLREQLRWVQAEQLDIAWRHHVHLAFTDSPVGQRRRDLVLALSTQDGPVGLRQLARLTPEVAAAYATRTQKTLARDLADLVQRELVVASGEGYIANRGAMLAYLLPRRGA